MCYEKKLAAKIARDLLLNAMEETTVHRLGDFLGKTDPEAWEKAGIAVGTAFRATFEVVRQAIENAQDGDG